MQSRILKQLLYILKDNPKGLSEFRLAKNSRRSQKTVQKYMLLAQKAGYVEHGLPNLWVPTEKWLRNFKVAEKVTINEE